MVQAFPRSGTLGKAIGCGLRRATQRGVSLVELMVAVTIGLIIVAALSQIYLTSRATYVYQEGMARVQEGGRFTMEFLTMDIRQAGYIGCNSNLTMATATCAGSDCTCPSGSICNILRNPDAANSWVPAGIQGYAYVGNGTSANPATDWSPAIPAAWNLSSGDIRPGTDVVAVQFASNLSSHLTGKTEPDNANIFIPDTAEIKDYINANDILLISDCKSADIFRTTNKPSGGSGMLTIAHGTDGNISPRLSHVYGNDAQIFKLVSRIYYIGTSTDGQEPALFMKELGTGGNVTDPQELVQGVEQMRLLFGRDDDNNKVANVYLSAKDVEGAVGANAWLNVVSVRLTFLVRTPSNVDVPTSIAYKTGETTFNAPDDRRRRHVFSTTVQLRNRI